MSNGDVKDKGILTQNSKFKTQNSAIVLAAGAARRFGRAKQLERWPEDGPALVEYAVRAALDCGASEIIVVTGNQAEAVEQLLQKLETPVPLKFCYNSRWQDGQGFSVAAGVQAVSPDAVGAIFFLSDQPRLSLTTPQILCQTFAEQPNPANAIILPTYNGKRGNPVIFGRNYFDALAQLNGDAGGREIVRQHAAAVLEVPVDDPAIHEDIDTQQDLAKLSAS